MILMRFIYLYFIFPKQYLSDISKQIRAKNKAIKRFL